MNACCICGRLFEGYGNDPRPVIDKPGKRCCDECNNKIVVTERMRLGERSRHRAERGERRCST